MSAGEIAFLALGALLGGGIAGLAISTVRARRGGRPTVRLTISPPSAVTAASTLSGPLDAWSEPAKGGPADAAAFGAVVDGGTESPAATVQAATSLHGDQAGDAGIRHADLGSTPTIESAPTMRTPVLNDGIVAVAGELVAVPVDAVSLPVEPVGVPVEPVGVPVEPVEVPVEPVAVPVEPDDEIDFLTLIQRRRGAAAFAGAGMPAAAGDGSVVPEPGAVALAERPSATWEAGSDVAAAPATGSSVAVAEPEAAAVGARSSAPSEGGELEEHRRAVRERCTVADRLKAAAVSAADSLRSEQRAYDVCLEQIRREESAVDGRAIRAAKDAAQHEFRSARLAARGHGDVEEAARRWLATIDSINHAARVAAVQLTRDRQAAARLAVRLERLSVEADAARIAAESATEACMVARQRLAAFEQGVALEPDAPAADVRLIPLDPSAPLPRIVRLLRGDHSALLDIVLELGGDDPAEQRRWQLQIATLVEGLVARALEMAWLDFPADHPFWGMFSTQQDRDISTSLASLGFRCDGLGGFVDGRVPDQRELSLAVGYAGLDPMRIRRWPDQRGLETLYEDVRVEAAEYLDAEAPSLTLGELVSILGQRAEHLTDLWNNWGRIRPLLLSAD